MLDHIRSGTYALDWPERPVSREEVEEAEKDCLRLEISLHKARLLVFDLRRQFAERVIEAEGVNVGDEIRVYGEHGYDPGVFEGVSSKGHIGMRYYTERGKPRKTLELLPWHACLRTKKEPDNEDH